MWIGTGAIILCGAHLGRGCIVGAKSVVSRPIPPYALAVGTPAKIVKSIFTIDEIIEHEKNLYAPNERMSREELKKLFEKYYKGMGSYGISKEISNEEKEILDKVKQRLKYVRFSI